MAQNDNQIAFAVKSKNKALPVQNSKRISADVGVATLYTHLGKRRFN